MTTYLLSKQSLLFDKTLIMSLNYNYVLIFFSTVLFLRHQKIKELKKRFTIFAGELYQEQKTPSPAKLWGFLFLIQIRSIIRVKQKKIIMNKLNTDIMTKLNNFDKAEILKKRHLKKVIEWGGTNMFTNVSEMSLEGTAEFLRLMSLEDPKIIGSSLTNLIQNEYDKD